MNLDFSGIMLCRCWCCHQQLEVRRNLKGKEFVGDNTNKSRVIPNFIPMYLRRCWYCHQQLLKLLFVKFQRQPIRIGKKGEAFASQLINSDRFNGYPEFFNMEYRFV